MSKLERPFRPVDLAATALEAFDLNALAAQLREESQYREEGMAGITLVRDDRISVVLQTMRQGTPLREHSAPASALVTLLSGRASFTTEGGTKRTAMQPGTLVTFAAGLDHAVVADEDCAFLLVIGGRTGSS
jgi:quercetin dioxygenase-like cupin family protein